MNKEEFLKELEYNLRYLSKTDRINELEKYKNINQDYLDPVSIANDIYKTHNKKIVITKKISFTEALSIIIKNIKLKDKNIIKNLILFLLYILLLIIVIKIPFIYTRDIISNLFNEIINTDKKFMIYNLVFEGLYAIATIFILTRTIKKKAITLEKNVK